ncbi:MAG: hypothetical protein FWG13_06860 [Leptospirales bacterium]|nr:hypothetical protein [Leptospirales bacterium]
MNKDIKIMIKLQSYWTEVINAVSSVERFKKEIRYLQDELKESEKNRAEFSEVVTRHRQTVKDKETVLSDLDQRIKKLDERKNSFKTQREVEAFESELNGLKRENGTLETELISLMDILAEEENSLEDMTKEIDDRRLAAAKSIAGLSEGIESGEETAALNKEKYDALLSELDAAYLQRFDKLLKSKNGKAVGEVQDEVCGVCNFKVPSHLASDAIYDDKVIVCTNCGSYIYRLS